MFFYIRKLVLHNNLSAFCEDYFYLRNTQFQLINEFFKINQTQMGVPQCRRFLTKNKFSELLVQFAQEGKTLLLRFWAN